MDGAGMTTCAQRKVIAFLVLTFALCIPFYSLIISAGTVNAAGGLYAAGLTWCPGVACLLTRLIFQRNLRGVGGAWGKTRYQISGYIIPLAACIAVYGIAWVAGIGGLSVEALRSGHDLFGIVTTASPLSTIILTATLVLLESAIFTTGEELGWRGLLVPELATLTGYPWAALITGLVWALFHYPLILYSDYTSGAPLWYVTVVFTVGIVAGSFVVSWLRLRSGSLWTAVIMHASHNAFTGLFNQLTISRRWTEFFTTEYGLGLAIAYSAVAYWCWKRRTSVPRLVARDDMRSAVRQTA